MLDSIPIVRDCIVTLFDGSTYYVPQENQVFIISLMHPGLVTHKYVPDEELVSRVLIQKLVQRSIPIKDGAVPFTITDTGKDFYEAIHERAIQRRIRTDWLKQHPEHDINVMKNCTIYDFDKEGNQKKCR